MTIQRKYTVESLYDLADHFESRAAAIEVQFRGMPSHRGFRAVLAAEANAWRAAADIVRHTTIDPPLDRVV